MYKIAIIVHLYPIKIVFIIIIVIIIVIN